MGILLRTEICCWKYESNLFTYKKEANERMNYEVFAFKKSQNDFSSEFFNFFFVELSLQRSKKSNTKISNRIYG